MISLRKYILLSLMLLSLLSGYAQQANKLIREGNRQYNDKKFNESETSYRKALEKKKEAFEPSFNIGDALYKQGKYAEAANQFEGITEHKLKDKDLAQVYHNLGNSLLNDKKYKESIEAYKNALRKAPDDKETKYNLSYALKMMQQQQQQQQKNKDNKDKDKNKDQDKKNQDKKDQDKKDQNKDQKKDQNKKDQDKKDDKGQQQQQQKQGISKEDSKRILESLQNDEKHLLEKLKRQQAVKSKKTTSKDW